MNKQNSAVYSGPELADFILLVYYTISSQMVCLYAWLSYNFCQFPAPSFVLESLCKWPEGTSLISSRPFIWKMVCCRIEQSYASLRYHLLLAPLAQCINSYKQLLKESLCSSLGQKWCFNKCRPVDEIELMSFDFFKALEKHLKNQKKKKKPPFW